ncbi:MAG TPA: hypothetical protein VE974_25615 [Thermoanaerobaculia bacterium]|nr:hypothetical protein [Thermoanaerobaculia bacterium]
MDEQFWESRDFWGPTLKYLGIALAATLGVIGTVWDTREERLNEKGVTEKRLGWAGKVLVAGIVVSSVLGTFGVIIEETQKRQEAAAADKARIAAKKQADAQIVKLSQITNDSKVALRKLEEVARNGESTLGQLGAVTSSSEETLVKLGAVSAEVQRARYNTDSLTVTVAWSMPDSDPTLNPIRDSSFMKNGTHLQNPADAETVRFFRELYKHCSVHVILRSGRDDLVVGSATTGSSEGRCHGEGLNCVNVSHSIRDGKIYLWLTMPFRFSKARLPTLYDFGGMKLESRLAFHTLEPHPVQLHVKEVGFQEESSKMVLMIGNRGNGYNALVATLPQDVGPRRGAGIHWR